MRRDRPAGERRRVARRRTLPAGRRENMKTGPSAIRARRSRVTPPPGRARRGAPFGRRRPGRGEAGSRSRASDAGGASGHPGRRVGLSRRVPGRGQGRGQGSRAGAKPRSRSVCSHGRRRTSCASRGSTRKRGTRGSSGPEPSRVGAPDGASDRLRGTSVETRPITSWPRATHTPNRPSAYCRGVASVRLMETAHARYGCDGVVDALAFLRVRLLTNTMPL